MYTAVLLCAVVIVYLVVATSIIRLSTRMVAGFFPTFSSAAGAIFVMILIYAVVAVVAALCGVGKGTARIPLALGSIAIQCWVYAVMLKDGRGGEIGFWQAFFVILCQIPLGFAVGMFVVFLFETNGSTLASLIPAGAQSRKAAAPAPRANISSARWGVLAVPVNVPTPYGNVSFRAGSPVQIVRETSSGYIIRLNGSEFSTTREQVVISR
jgi:hypothetical protein